ncbi:hypothetical protein BH09MYX1_BH09MYX1_06910 [soil metagenome]
MRSFRTLLLALAVFLVAFSALADDVDRTTPRRAYSGFMAASHDGDFERAAKYLDLRSIARAKRANEGPALAQSIAWVLERHVTVAEGTLPDDPADPREVITAASLVVDEDTVPIDVARVRSADGSVRWMFAKSTVTAIPELTVGYGPNRMEDRVPRALRRPYVLGLAPWQWIGIALALVVAAIVGRVAVAISRIAVKRFLRRVRNKSIDEVASAGRAPSTLFFAVLTFRGLAPLLSLTLAASGVVSDASTLVLLLAIAWLSIRLLAVVPTWVGLRETRGDALEARALRTQLSMLRRVASIAIGIIAIAAALLQFEVVRSIGTSLLASAGIAGIVLGLAAQKSIGALIAGIQISIAQPVRLGDTVVIEGQQGVVEEIHLTYLVVRLGDDRRLVAPLSRFLDQPFENWTRLGTDMKGAVLFRADFTVPIDRFRKELVKICEASPFWDKRVATIRVVDSDASSITLRAFVSAKSSEDLWELRCVVREKLNEVLVELEDGRFLPRQRTRVMTV